MADSTQLRKVLETISDFGRAATRVRRAQEEVDLLEVQWIDMASPVEGQPVEADDPEYIEDEVLVQFLRSGDASIIPLSYHRQALLEMRDEVLGEYQTRLEELQRIADDWAVPHKVMVQELTAWLEAARVGAASGTVAQEWAAILKAWRKAADLTTREAAEHLNVSPSAVTRYEGGTRAASLPYIASMVQRIDAVGLVEREEKRRKIFRALAEMVGRSDPTDVLEEVQANVDLSRARSQQAKAHLAQARSQLQAQIDRMSLKDITTVARLVQPPVLKALRTLIAELAPEDMEATS